LKVAHICTTALSHKILVDKLSLMQTLGYEIHLISSEEGYDRRLVDEAGLTVRFVPMVREIKPLADFRAVYQLYRLLKKENYSIVHTHTAKAGVIGRIAAWFGRTPVIVHTTHGLPFYEGQSRMKNRIYRTMEKVGSLFCHAIASQNREDIDKIKGYAPGIPVYYEGNGVDLPSLDERRSRILPEQLQSIRQQLSIGESTPVLLMAARFEPVKNHLFLLEGLHDLKKRYTPDFVCMIAGRGELESQIRERIAVLGLEDQVRLIGHQSDIYPYLQLSDAVVLTSEKEGIPRIVMEAMAFGKPVVASDVLGTRELVAAEKTGLLAPYKDINALSRQLSRIISDDGLRRELGYNGRRAVELEFTEEKVIRRIHNYYLELLPASNRPEQVRLPI
jgi:glycosyltransferase involved in cell wall biosynthesis